MQNTNIKRKAYFLDTYCGFHYEEANNSCDVHWDKTHKIDEPHIVINKIKNNLSHIKNIDFKLIKNNIISDELPSEIKKIAVANIDVDIYEGVYAAIIKVAPLISKNGIIICEDATSTPGLIGAYFAMEKFLKSDMGKNFIKIFMRSQYFLIRVNN